MAIHRQMLVLVCHLLYMCEDCCVLARLGLQDPFMPSMGFVSLEPIVKESHPTPCRLSVCHMPCSELSL